MVHVRPASQLNAIFAIFLGCFYISIVACLESPGDYPFDHHAGRVNGLVQFFETLQDIDTFKDKPSIIGLTEAASKLHVLASGSKLVDMCSRYYRLIEKPNIRTLETVRELVNEHIDETDIPDAHLLTRLANERSFDALGRIFTIISSLDSEKTADGASSYSVPVQHDLLDCLEYLIYRHGRATDGILAYVSDRRSAILVSDNLSDTNSGGALSKPTLPSSKYQPLVDKVAEIESRKFSEPADYKDWIQALKDLQNMVVEDDFTIPRSVEVFLRDPQRMNTLRTYAQMLERAEGLEKNLENFEQDKESDCKSIDDYVNALNELSDLIENNPGKFPFSLVEFVQDPARSAFIDKTALENYENGQANDRCRNIGDYTNGLERLNETVVGNPGKIPQQIVEFAKSSGRKAFLNKNAMENFENNKSNDQCKDITDYGFLKDSLNQEIDSNSGKISQSVVDFSHDPNREAFLDKYLLQDFENGQPNGRCRDIDDYIGILADLNDIVDKNSSKIPQPVLDYAKSPARKAFIDYYTLSNFENGVPSDRCKNISDYADILDELNQIIDQNPWQIPQSTVDFAKLPARKALIDKGILENFENGKTGPRCEDLKDYSRILSDMIKNIDTNEGRLPSLVIEFAKSPARKAFMDKKVLEDYENEIPSRHCGNIDDYKKLLDSLRDQVNSDKDETLPKHVVDFAKDPSRNSFIQKNKIVEIEKNKPYVSQNPNKNSDKKNIPLEIDEIGDCREWLGDLCSIKGRTVDLNNVHRYVTIFNKLEDLCYNRYIDATKYIDRKRQLFYQFINELREWYKTSAPKYEADPDKMTPGDTAILKKTKEFLDANELREADLRKKNMLR